MTNARPATARWPLWPAALPNGAARSAIRAFIIAASLFILLLSAPHADSATPVWGDADCSGEVTPSDGLTLLHDESVTAQGVGCPAIGDPFAVTWAGGAATLRWGDNNCDGLVTGADVLPLLAASAGVGRPGSASCPAPGAAVSLIAATPQLWAHTYGSTVADEAWGVDTDADGNIYLATHQSTPGTFPDMVIYKLRPDGSEIWQKTWGGPWTDHAFIVVVDRSTVYIGGSTQHAFGLNDTVDMALVALDTSTGDKLWDFTWDQGFGYEELDGVVPDGDYVYLAGWTTGEHTSNDLVLHKLERSGHIVWTETWGTDGWDEANGQIVVDANRIYVTGRYDAPNVLFGGDGLIASFSKATGDLIDYKTWGGDLIDNGLGLTSDGAYLYTIGFTGSEGNGLQLELRKYTKDLQFVWRALWGGSGNEYARVAEVDAAGIVVAGGTGPIGSSDVCFLRFDLDGNLLWAHTWGGGGDEFAHGLALHGNTAYIAGQTTSFGAGGTDGFLLSANDATGELPATP